MRDPSAFFWLNVIFKKANDVSSITIRIRGNWRQLSDCFSTDSNTSPIICCGETIHLCLGRQFCLIAFEDRLRTSLSPAGRNLNSNVTCYITYHTPHNYMDKTGNLHRFPCRLPKQYRLSIHFYFLCERGLSMLD